MLRSRDPALGLLLERMQHVHACTELHGVDHTVCVPVIVDDQFTNAQPLQCSARQQLLSGRRLTSLGQVQKKSNIVMQAGGEAVIVLLRSTHPNERAQMREVHSSSTSICVLICPVNS